MTNVNMTPGSSIVSVNDEDVNFKRRVVTGVVATRE